MLDWSTPLLLLLLGLVPLLRWLHRRRAAETEVVVSALFLWPRAETAANEPRRSQKPDPRWRLRGLIVALLVAGAAGPLLVRPGLRRIDVLFDDSGSMRARENATTRLDVALRALGDALAQSDNGDLRILSLSQPGRMLTLNPRQPQEWLSGIARWVKLDPRNERLPAPAQLDAERERWLVTDGTNPAVGNWVRDAQIQRVLWVGKATENVGVTRLAVRPQLRAPDWLRGIVRLKNGGMQNATRQLEVATESGTIIKETIDLAPAAAVQRAFNLRASAAAGLRATIAPADALPDDDELALAAAHVWSLRVRLDPRCGAHLRDAIQSHPRLTLTADANPDLTVWCSGSAPSAENPVLWFRAGSAPLAGQALLSTTAGVQPLILEHRTPNRVLEVRADTESPTWARQPEYVALLSELLDRTLGWSLLDWNRSVDLPETAVAIAPHEPGSNAKVQPVKTTGTPVELSPVALVLAAFLLMLDTWRTGLVR